VSFTPTQKSSIRFYLGYQDQFRQINTSLESQLNDGGLSDTATTIVVGILASLAATDAELVNAHKRMKASKVGSIMLNEKELSMLRSEGRRFVRRLASVFGITPRNDVYGDGMAGGVIPLG
jgi:hypothetical protein